MSNPLDVLLRDVARETFEQLAFILSPEDDAPAEPGDERTVCVTFRGPFSGALTITLSAPLLPTLAANMLGMEDAEITPNDHEDAFRELANVICGNLLPRIAGARPVFEVGAPCCLPAGAGAGDASDGVAVAATVLPLEGGRAALRLAVNDPAALESARVTTQEACA